MKLRLKKMVSLSYTCRKCSHEVNVTIHPYTFHELIIDDTISTITHACGQTEFVADLLLAQLGAEVLR